jgi:hypothetical protein
MTRVAYPVAAHGKSAHPHWALLVFGAVAMAAGCKAGVVATQSGTGGHAGSSSGSAGTQGSGGTGNVGGPGLDGFDRSIMIDPDAGACQQAQYTFEPKIPTVYLVVDRSGSMFHCLSGDTGSAVCGTPANTAWSNLKEAVRSVVGPLDAQVRFGFATIWGTDPSQGGTCPSIQGMTTDNVAPALNNATAIMAKYDSLAFPPNTTQQGMKFESPASESIQVVAAALTADTTVGDKYIIFITDGQPDYCDDSNSLCAPDSVIARIQAAKTAGITTIVLGIQTTLFDLPAGILKAYATAGAGEPTVAPLRNTSGTTFDFYDQCNGITGWKADMTALGKPNARGTTLGTYMTTAGPTNPYMPSASDQNMLQTQLAAALSGVKSCTFDLSSINGKSIRVDLNQLNKASVTIEGNTIALDATNGWSMATGTQLVLNGTACDTWQSPNVKNIAFNFPCEIIVE